MKAPAVERSGEFWLARGASARVFPAVILALGTLFTVMVVVAAYRRPLGDWTVASGLLYALAFPLLLVWASWAGKGFTVPDGTGVVVRAGGRVVANLTAPGPVHPLPGLSCAPYPLAVTRSYTDVVWTQTLGQDIAVSAAVDWRVADAARFTEATWDTDLWDKAIGSLTPMLRRAATRALQEQSGPLVAAIEEHLTRDAAALLAPFGVAVRVAMVDRLAAVVVDAAQPGDNYSTPRAPLLH